jgi:hypothetical protein
MRKLIYFILFLAIIPIPVSGQIFDGGGDGSFADPYSGYLMQDATLSGSVYFNGDITIDAFTLTISPGTKIIFTAVANINVNSDGVLFANGGSGTNGILFTADNNNNGTYGETGERWGHISFEYMSTSSPSVFNYCTIEYGTSGNLNYGGAISVIGFNQLSITNSIIRYNSALRGGGILISGSSPVIENDFIVNNTATGSATTHGGGGIIILGTSAPSVTNCIIANNSATSASNGRGGGVYLYNTGSARFINCVIASNTAAAATYPGNNILYRQNNSPEFINSIVWGSANSISYYTGTSLSASDLNYCAIQGYTTGYTNCITLSGTNTDPTGPNFTNPGASDYSISTLSPCRDAGVNTFLGVTIPTTDILGNPILGTKDIGAYEVQYSRWNGGTTEWDVASNWEGNLVPTTTSQIVIPGELTNYPNAGSITIGATGSLIIEAGASVQTTTFSNAGLVIFKSSETQTSTLFAYYYTLTGQTKVEMFLKGGVSPTGPRWHWITSPFSVSKSLFTTNPTSDNLLNYTESSVTTNINQGWNWHDGYGSTTGFSTLEPFTGYDVYYTSDHTYTFSGTAFQFLGYYPTVVNLAFSGTDINLHGWNLVGNSFLHSINWDNVIKSSGVHNALYMSTNNSVATWINGVGVNGATNVVAPLQAFFVKVDATGQTLSFSRNAVSLDTRPRLKSSEVTDTLRLVRINISNNGIVDESVIRLVNDGSDNFNNTYDAFKFPSGATIPQIYVKLLNLKYSIKSINVPDTAENIPISVTIPAAGDFAINCTDLKEMYKYEVTLKDNSNQQITDLNKIKSYTFHADAAGAVDDRFVINISKISKVVPVVPIGQGVPVVTYVDKTVLNEQQFNIYSSQGIINVVPLQDAWNGQKAEIKIINITGTTVAVRTNIGFSNGNPETFNLNIPTGIYFVSISTSTKKFVGKINIVK